MPVNPYDVYIDGKGYIIKEGTYAGGKQQLNADQLRTGDPSYANLTDQQAWPQTDFRGGITNMKTPDNTNFSASNEIEIISDYGSFRLANNFSSSTLNQLTSYDTSNNAKGFYNGDIFTVHNSTLYYKNLSASFYSAGVNLSSSGTRDFENFAGKLYATNVSTNTLWASSSPKTAAAWSAELSALGFSPAKIVGFQSKLFISEDLASFAIPGPTLRQYDGVSVTDAFTSNKWLIINMALFNGRIYMGCVRRNDTTTYALRVYDGSTDWTVQIFERVDSVTSDKPNNSFNIMRAYNGKLYFNIADYESVNQIMSFDGQTITTELNLGTKKASYSYFEDTVNVDDCEVVNGTLYVAISRRETAGLNNYESIYACPGGLYWYKLHEVYNQNARTTGILLPYNTTSLFGLEYQMAGKMWRETQKAGTGLNQGSAFASSGAITSNYIDMDLFSVNKRVTALEVYHSALPSGKYIKADLFSYGDTSAQAFTATITNSNIGSTRTVLVPTNAVGKQFQYSITLSSAFNGSGTPEVSDVVARWILEPEDKQQVVFDVMAVDNLQLNDGSYETRTGAQIAADLKIARKKGIVSFTDLDGTVYNPTTGNPDSRGMIIKDAMYKSQFDQANSAEFVVSVTMVQA